MHYYISKIVGGGTRRDPCRPLGSHSSAGWGMIDLRLSGDRLDGLCIVALDERPDLFGMEYLGEDLADKVHLSARNRLRNKLGISFNRDENYAGLLRQLLHPVEGIANNSRWKPIRMTHKKRWQAFLRGRAIFDEPAVAGGASDDFTRADEDPIQSPWLGLAGNTGDVNLTSGRVTGGGTDGDKFYYYNGAATSADQWSEMQQHLPVDADDWGPAVRIGSGGNFSGYWFSQGGLVGINKFVNNVFSVVEEYTIGIVANFDVNRIEVSGSTITAKRNGTEVNGSPSTDTDLSAAGNGVGFFLFEQNGSLDHWRGGNLPATTSVGFNNSGEMVSRTTGMLNMNAAYTVMFWACSMTDLNDYTHFWAINDSTSETDTSDTDFAGSDNDGGTARLGFSVGGSFTGDTGTNVYIRVWTHYAIVRSSISGTLKLYLNGVEDCSIAADATGRNAEAKERFGTFNNFRFEGRITAIKEWSTALTPTEILAEMPYYNPQKQASLHCVNYLKTHSNLTDTSGNGRDLTATGTLSTEDGPDITDGPLDIFNTRSKRASVISLLKFSTLAPVFPD